MKKFLVLYCGALLCSPFMAYTQEAENFNLHALAQNKGIEVFNRELSLLQEAARTGIRLSKAEGEGVAWIQGLEFSEGIIEFDVRGENVKQHSFVGIAFHGVDNYTFDAIYLRPFQFQEQDETLRARMIQYVSLPNFHWRSLRADSPGKYENSINPSPDPDAWVHMKIVINGGTISTFINNSTEPSLVVRKLTTVSNGRVGLYVADTSGGDFANLTIIKTK
jgi:hypothetical protein